MAIKLTCEPLLLKTKYPFGISSGTTSERNNVLVKLEYEGTIGLGEAAPVGYLQENQSVALDLLTKWSQENILGDDPFTIDRIMQRLDQAQPGYNSAKAAVEMALYDLVGKLMKTPVHRMFELSHLALPPTSFTIGIDNLNIIQEKTKEAVSNGFKFLKVKQGTGTDESDRQIIKCIRQVTNLPIRVDANCAWTIDQAITMSHFLAENNVEFIEQPLPRNCSSEDFARVKKSSALPIFADESVLRLADLGRIAKSIDGLVIKLDKCGGLQEALKLVDAAKENNLKIMLGCMIESSISISAAAQIGGLFDYIDLDGALLLAQDPFKGVQYKNGSLHLQELPGLGVAPN